MAQIILHEAQSPEKLIHDMNEDACFDISDDRDGNISALDPSLFSDIHAKPAPPTVPKVFLSNNCIFNCAYCTCRCTNDKERYCNEPRDLARLAVAQALQNGRGVFVTSAIYRNADYTQELIAETLRSIRNDLHYGGYVHAKVMPGADPLLIEQTGLYADRLSVNIEVAQSQGYEQIAKQKNKRNILTPMRQISEMVAQARQERGRRFASSQTTQLMAGSTQEDDRTILRLSSALYRQYGLKRVYYTAFQYRHPAQGYSDIPFTATPRWRVQRLYQADRLLQLYGFSPEEIAPPDAPSLPSDLDPKAAWALRHLDQFPVEVNRADYESLIRVPGIGTVYAKKILRARRYCTITHDVLHKIGIPLKKSVYFITCNGKFLGGAAFDNSALLHAKMVDAEPPSPSQLSLGWDGSVLTG